MQKIIYKKKGLKGTPRAENSLNPSFIPVFDSTDHFHFACYHCHEIAFVQFVNRNDSYANTPTLYFWLECPKCGNKGFRKIYLEDEEKHFLVFPLTSELLAQSHMEACPGIITQR